jgi:hypothetical protein
MLSDILELKIAKKIQSGIEEFQVVTPAANAKVIILNFFAEGPYTLNSEVRIVWNHGAENEEILWAVKGSGKMPIQITIPPEEVDGIKKLALVCENGELGALTMNGYIKVRVITP